MSSPPCGESVIWLVQREKPKIVATKQVENIASVIYKATEGHGNYRAPMPVAGRKFTAVKASKFVPLDVSDHISLDYDEQITNKDKEHKFLPLGPNPRTDAENSAYGLAKTAVNANEDAIKYMNDFKNRVLDATRDYREEMENLGDREDW